MNPRHEHNRRAWDERVLRGDWYIDTATDHDFENALTIVDPCGWLDCDLAGKHVLCLAAGGGRHGVLFAALGADVTVVDISPKMLELDRELASKRKLSMRLIESSMDDLSELGDAFFDLVFQPVSSCYVSNLTPVYREVARVTLPGGLYISQHKQPLNMTAEAAPSDRGYAIIESYYRSGPLPAAPHGAWHRESGTIEFVHRWDDLLGKLCRSGFEIEDVAEPRHGDPTAERGTFAHRSLFIPPYIRIKARRSDSPSIRPAPRLWTPSNENR